MTGGFTPLGTDIHSLWKETIMRKKMIAFFALVFLVGSCASMETNQGKQQTLSSPPVITQAFAAKEMRLGDIWKIYLNASDPNGEMNYIAATIDQPGRGGAYPPSRTRIKANNRQELSGFVYLDTTNNIQQGLEFTNITLTVQIQDRKGNISNPVAFPLHFRMSAVQEPPPSDIFKQEDLGPIMIQIRPLGDSGKGVD
jgi:hypothetical protein